VDREITEQAAESFESGCGIGKVVEGTQGGAETILFVEDEAFVRDVTREVLLATGYAVLTARTAAEGLIAYQEHHGAIDLLLTDIVLPGESGHTLASKLRLLNPEMGVLFVTGYPEQMNVREAESAECLAKPFSTGVLLRRIRELLDRRQVWRQESRLVKHASGCA
jgi:two-component system, cell cycle sensor histidine kinase and response regulator CckA